MSDPPIGEMEHDWFRRRLDEHALGMLDDADERSFLAHVAACAACGDELKAYHENVARIVREGHIPARLLARWDRARGRLRGMARRMVREHLESCAECRQDLEAVGFRPELEVVGELEAEAEPETRVARTSPPRQPMHEIRLVMPTRRGWAPWWAGGVVGAALGTAATLVVVGTLSDRAQLYPVPMPTEAPSPTRPAPAPAPPPPILDVLAPPLALRGPLRGASDAEVPTLRVEPGARFVQLALPELFLADSVTLVLRVIGPDGATKLDARRRYSELQAGRTLLFGELGTVLAPGDYRLEVGAPAVGEPAVGAYRFRIVR
jgi:hypothetical protein